MNVLEPLVGLPLVDCTRAADLQGFHFGARRPAVDRRGHPPRIAEYALHIHCAWRILEAGAITAASRDRYVPAGDPEDDPPGFEWDRPGANLCDERVAAFLSRQMEDPPVVLGIEPREAGAFAVRFERGIALEIFPDDSRAIEHWRLFRPGSDDPHAVFVGTALE